MLALLCIYFLVEKSNLRWGLNMPLRRMTSASVLHIAAYGFIPGASLALIPYL